MRAALCAVALALSALAAVVSAQNCRDAVAECDSGKDYFPDKVTMESAGATVPNVEYMNTHVDLTIVPGVGADEYKYRLVRCGCEDVAGVPEGVTAISVPPKGLYVGDSIIMSMLTTEVDARDFIKAVGPTAFAYSPQVKRLVNESVYQEVADPKELIGNEDVSLAIINQFSIDGYENATKDGLEAPFLLSAESAEVDPLGRAEWVKIFGIILDKPVSTSKTYDSIKFRYSTVKEQAFSVRRRPSAMVNFPFGGTWSQPGGKQYTAAFLRDANVDYRFANDGSSTSNILSYDELVRVFGSARYWVNVGRFPGSTDDTTKDMLDEIEAEDLAAMKELASVKCGKVWAQMKRLSPDGNANDFFEQGALRPDLVLTDFLKIFHPTVSSITEEEMTFAYSMGMPSDGQTAACPFNELPLDAPDGKVFRTTELEVVGADRFVLEDQLAAGKIAPEVADAAGVDPTDVEIFFDRAVEESSSNSSFVKVRSMIDSSAEDDFEDSSIANAFSSGADGVTSATAISSESSSTSRSGDSGSDSDGLGGGAIAGIVIGSLLALALVALGTFWFASRRSTRAAYQEIKDRFYAEHGVRLAEDDAGTRAAEPRMAPVESMGDDIQAAV